VRVAAYPVYIVLLPNRACCNSPTKLECRLQYTVIRHPTPSTHIATTSGLCKPIRPCHQRTSNGSHHPILISRSVSPRLPPPQAFSVGQVSLLRWRRWLIWRWQSVGILVRPGLRLNPVSSIIRSPLFLVFSVDKIGCWYQGGEAHGCVVFLGYATNDGVRL
jgi:hypothetical protein